MTFRLGEGLLGDFGPLGDLFGPGEAGVRVGPHSFAFGRAEGERLRAAALPRRPAPAAPPRRSSSPASGRPRRARERLAQGKPAPSAATLLAPIQAKKIKNRNSNETQKAPSRVLKSHEHDFENTCKY